MASVDDFGGVYSGSRAPAEEDAARPAVSTRRLRLRRSAEDARERRRIAILWGLSVALCVLLVNSLLGENGYLATVRTEREEAALSATVAQLRLENQQLQQEGRRLASDPSALEETARRELNFIKPGETLVIIHDAGANAPGAAVK